MLKNKTKAPLTMFVHENISERSLRDNKITLTAHNPPMRLYKLSCVVSAEAGCQTLQQHAAPVLTLPH